MEYVLLALGIALVLLLGAWLDQRPDRRPTVIDHLPYKRREE